MAGRSYPRQLYLYAVDNNNDNNNIMCYSIFGGIFSQPRLTTGCIVLKPQKITLKRKGKKYHRRKTETPLERRKIPE